MILTSFCALLIIALFLLFRIKKYSLISQIPSSKKKFLLHNTFELLGLERCELFKKLESLHADLGDIFHLTFHPFDCGTIFIADYEIAKALSLHQPDRSRSSLYKSLSRWIGSNGLFLASGHQQKSRLKFVLFLLGPKFYPKYKKIANFHVEAALKFLISKAEKQVDVSLWASQVTLDVVFSK
jgi:cytochrome P450